MHDPLRSYPGYRLRLASLDVMAGLARRLDSWGLRPSEATVLTVIAANPQPTQSDIGRLLSIASANMTPLVSRLVARRLIERHPVDGRSHGLALTTRGRVVAHRVKQAIDEYESSVLERIPAAHRTAFLAALDALVEAPAHPPAQRISSTSAGSNNKKSLIFENLV